MSAFRSRRRRRLPLLIHVDLDDVLDGFPCPYCGQVTAPDAEGVWKCLCGWSGVLLVPDVLDGHPGAS